MLSLEEEVGKLSKRAMLIKDDFRNVRPGTNQEASCKRKGGQGCNRMDTEAIPDLVAAALLPSWPYEIYKSGTKSKSNAKLTQ